MDIFVGSLSFKLRESELREAFEKYGMVSSAKIIIDKITRQSKGFGFVEMPNEDEARTAIRALNGADMYGRPLVVNESQKREQRPSTSGPGDRYAAGDRAPRGDFKREGFNRPPRPTEGDTNRNTGFQPRERPANVDSDDDDDEDGASSRPSRPAPGGGSSFGGSSFGGGGFGGGNAGSAPDRHRTPDRKPASQERRFNDRNNSANKSDNRYSKGGEYYKKGGGGSKRDWDRGDDDDY